MSFQRNVANVARRTPVYQLIEHVYDTKKNAPDSDRLIRHSVLIALLGMNEAAVKTSVRQHTKYSSDIQQVRKDLILNRGITLSNLRNIGYIVNKAEDNVCEVQRKVNRANSAAGSSNLIAVRTPAADLALTQLENKYVLPRRVTSELRVSTRSAKRQLTRA